jgi:hypothetical protein
MANYRPSIPALVAVLLGLGACSAPGGGDSTTSADTLTRRQKDSIISTFPIPGAGAVGRALDASDAAAERARRLDSLGGGR